jgi:hypothetical protein
MGCDIHLHIEIKIESKWHHYNHPNVNRNYHLFSKMANVRNYPEYNIKPISEPKGFPEDATFTTKFDYENWGNDAHSPSWLDKHDIELLEYWFNQHQIERHSFEFNKQFGYLFGNDFSSINDKEDDCIPKDIEDVRFVFWFDN